MRYRVSVKGWGNTLTTAHLTLEEAEARIAESIRINSDHEGGSSPRARDDYVITEVDEPSKPCIHCGAEVVCDSHPETDFCRMCFYTGAHHTAVHAATCERLSGMLGNRKVTVWQTGGGCMAFGAVVGDDDGEILISSELDVDADPDEPVWGYWVAQSFGEEGWNSDHGYGEDELTLWEAADRAGKLASMPSHEFNKLVATQV